MIRTCPFRGTWVSSVWIKASTRQPTPTKPAAVSENGRLPSKVNLKINGVPRTRATLWSRGMDKKPPMPHLQPRSKPPFTASGSRGKKLKTRLNPFVPLRDRGVFHRRVPFKQ